MLKRKYMIFLLTAALGVASVWGASAFGHQDEQKDKQKADIESVLSTVYSGEGGYLGVYLEEVTSDRAKELNLSEERGAMVMRVVEGSPAEAAGLKKNDVIVSFNGRRVDSVRELQRLLKETPVGRTASIEIVRAGSKQTLNAKLDKRSNRFSYVSPGRVVDSEVWKRQEEAMKRSLEAWEQSQKDAQQNFDNYNFVGPGSVWFLSRSRLGVTVESLSNQLAEFFGAKDGKGVLVSEVREGSPAAAAGLKAGDVIIAIDSEKIAGVNDLLKAVNKKEEGPVTLTVIRNHTEQTITVTLEKSEQRFAPRRRTNVSTRAIATA